MGTPDDNTEANAVGMTDGWAEGENEFLVVGLADGTVVR